MGLTFIDVFLVFVAALSLGVGIGVGVGLTHLTALSFLRYAHDYLERIKAHKTE